MAKKTVNKKGGPSQVYSKQQIKEALFIAACEQHPDGSFGYKKAQDATGINRQSICDWVERYPEIVEENRPAVEAMRAKRDDELKELYLQGSLLAVKFSIKAVERCFDENDNLILEPRYNKDGKLIGKSTVETLRDVVGMAHIFTDKKQLLEGKPTGNVGGNFNITEKLIIELHEIEKAERLKTLNGSQNRLKKYNLEN